MTPWGAVRWAFHRCPAWRYVPDGSTMPWRIYCERGRPHWGVHASYTFDRSWS